MTAASRAAVWLVCIVGSWLLLAIAVAAVVAAIF